MEKVNLVILGSGLEALILNYIAAGIVGVNPTIITEMATPCLADRYPDRPTSLFGDSQILCDILEEFGMPYDRYKAKILREEGKPLKLDNIAFDWKGLAAELAIEASPIVGRAVDISGDSLTYESNGETATIPCDLLVIAEDELPGTVTLWIRGTPSSGPSLAFYCSVKEGWRVIQTGEFYAFSFPTRSRANDAISLIDDFFDGDYVVSFVDVEKKPSYFELLDSNHVRHLDFTASRTSLSKCYFEVMTDYFMDELTARVEGGKLGEYE